MYKNLDNILAKRRPTKKIKLGKIQVGGDSDITVQTMTNTNSADLEKTIEQIDEVCEAGADIVRVSCPDQVATFNLKKIVEKSKVPIVADIHFHYKRAIEAAEAGAACLRINPGNIGSKDRLVEVVRAAKSNDCAIRIGVNGGSLGRDLLEKYKEPCSDALVESALINIRTLEDLNFDRIKVSVKASNPHMVIASYRKLSKATDYPLHLGVTEAGPEIPGIVKSSFALGLLLSEGIGDTIRISLSAKPVREIIAGFEILKALKLRQRGVNLISCPSCARQQFDVLKIVAELEQKLAHIRAPLTVSIIGCVVNGPGEAKVSDIGLTGGGNHTHQLYLHGVSFERLKNKNIVDHIVALVEKQAEIYESNYESPTES